MKRRHVTVALVTACLLVPTLHGDESDDLLTRLKAAYLYNLTRFVQWPDAAGDRPFVIGVVGDGALEAQLRVLEREHKRAGGRPIRVRGYPNIDAIEPSELLFVGSAAAPWLPAIVRRSAGAPTLLVGDLAGGAGRGLAIELYRKPDLFRDSERLRLRIDRRALAGRGLKVSARLYDVAEVVE